MIIKNVGRFLADWKNNHSWNFLKLNKYLHSLGECYGEKMEKQIVISESYERYADKYKRNSYSIGVFMLELEWCPKYRYKMFRKWKYKKLVEACIRRAASLHGIKWIELNVHQNMFKEQQRFHLQCLRLRHCNCWKEFHQNCFLSIIQKQGWDIQKVIYGQEENLQLRWDLFK